MRLTERETYFRHKRGVMTMADAARERKEVACAAKKKEEVQKRAAKAATRGPALLEVDDAR